MIRQTHWCRCFTTVTLIAAGAWLLHSHAGAPQVSVGKRIDAFRLKDAAGKAVAPGDFKDKKAFVVVFLGTQCPINNLYLATLAELHREFAEKGVQFLGINSNWQDSPRAIADHADKYKIPFPVLRDDGAKVAGKFGATRTPEAFVLDAGLTVRYQGRIDDQFGIDIRRAKPTRQDLAEAVGEVLAGKKVSRPWTTVAGCIISRPARAKKGASVTFSKDIAAILQNKCQECHRPGQIGPMPLMTYADASAWADTIREVVSEGRMPPWHADPKHGRFANDRSLSARDKETLLAWIDVGMPRGDDRDLPPPRKFPKGWTIGKPDVIIPMPVEYEVPAVAPKRGLPYRHFVVETNFDEDKWVERAEAKAGAAEVVHHIIAFIVPPGERFFPGSPRTPVLCGTAPGDMPMMLKPGQAKHLPKGSKLIFQMHYTPNGKAQKDRSEIGLIFARQQPSMKVVTLPIYNLLFRIPPEAANHEVVSTYTCKKDCHIVGFMPHMHLRGKDFLIRARYPDGKSATLLSVPRFNFNWQSIYRPIEPLRMPKGTVVECVAHFDNSAGNPNNPDPKATVTWGDQTWEEMMIGWTDFAFEMK
ncbi:MAG: redoxin domain-containing protein [Planctomycetes bacterium]|nr:redoxin domain-containing protein [Planctomycetota bacterium]